MTNSGFSSHGGGASDYAKEAQLQAMITERNRTLRSLSYAKLRIDLYKGVFIAGFFVLLWNASFTYTSARNFLNNADLAIGLTVIITAVQIVVNGAFFSGSLNTFNLLDLNGDGKVTRMEKAIGGLFLAGIASCYILDIGTNLLGVDIRGAQEMGTGIASAFLAMFDGVNMPELPDWINEGISILVRIIGFIFMIVAAFTPLACATLLCIGDELCTILSEREISKIQATLPDLRRSKAILDKRIRDADAFTAGLNSQSSDASWKEGANFKI